MKSFNTQKIFQSIVLIVFSHLEWTTLSHWQRLQPSLPCCPLSVIEAFHRPFSLTKLVTATVSHWPPSQSLSPNPHTHHLDLLALTLIAVLQRLTKKKKKEAATAETLKDLNLLLQSYLALTENQPSLFDWTRGWHRSWGIETLNIM